MTTSTPAGPSTERPRPLRADAERNRRRILDAAREVFARRGLEAGLDEIAKHAGVGTGTVYRRFPDKAVLVEALFEERLALVLASIRQAADLPDPWEGFVLAIESLSRMQIEDRGLKDVFFGHFGDAEAFREHHDRILPLVEASSGRTSTSPTSPWPSSRSARSRCSPRTPSPASGVATWGSSWTGCAWPGPPRPRSALPRWRGPCSTPRAAGSAASPDLQPEGLTQEAAMIPRCANPPISACPSPRTSARTSSVSRPSNGTRPAGPCSPSNRRGERAVIAASPEPGSAMSVRIGCVPVRCAATTSVIPW